MEFIATFDAASHTAKLCAGQARDELRFASDMYLWPSIVDVRVQKVADKSRYRGIVMDNHVEVQVLGCFDGVLHWDPSLEGSKIVIGAYCWTPSRKVGHELL